jgi:hypothetical protein
MSYSTLSQVGDNIYVNVSFNHDDSQGNQPTPAEYIVTKTLPILSKCDDYYCSVIRFDIPLNSTPLFIMPIVPNQPDADLTPLIIGITYLGVNFPVNIEYIPDNILTAPLQNQPAQVITPYYFVFSFQNLINAINLALAEAVSLSGVKAVLDAIPAKTPWFYLDPTTKLISLVVPTLFTNPAAVPGKPLIYMNAQLSTYLEAFQKSQVGYNQPQGHDFVFILDFPSFPAPPFPSSNPYPQSDKAFFPIPVGGPDPAGVYTYYKFTQEYSTLQLWSSLRKILITTNSIPIISEYTPTGNSGISSTLPIITDFVPQIEIAGQSRSIAFYTPTSQYRLVDLKSSEQLNTIDLKIYWQDDQSNIYPLLISVFQQANIKLVFVKKSLYKGGLNLLK